MIVSRFAMSEECVRFVSGKFFLNDSGLTVRTRDESKMSQEFLDQQLLTRSNEIYATARGTAQKNMDMTMFRAMELSYPDSLKEQKRIVALLDAATARVTELTACYEQARTHANNLFTSALRDALESNPDWPKKVIGDVCELSLGKMLDSKQRTGLHPTRYLRNVNVRWGSIDTSDMSIMDIRPEEMDRVTASPGDVIVCEGGEPGRCAVWRGPGRIAIQKALHRVRPKNEIDANYVALYLAFLAEMGELKYFFTGTTIKHIPKEKLHLVPIPVPPLEEQKGIVARLDSLRAKTSEMVGAYDAKLQVAKKLRQSILEAAFAGEL
jgi:type I restriction enzyme S subunit